MKSTNFYRLMLALPYPFLIPGWIAMRDVFKSLSVDGPIAAPSGNLFNTIIAFWGFTGVFWIIPYTIFALGLLVWSIGKSKETIRTWYTRSPYILGVLSPFFFLLLSPFQSMFTDKNVTGAAGFYICIGTVCSMPLSLIYGFVFIGIGFLLYSISMSIGVIKD